MIPTQLLARATALAQSGRVVEALPLFQKLAKAVPKDPAIQFSLGNAYRMCGRLSDAIVQFEKVVKTAPHMVDARLNLALAYNELQQPEKGMKHALAVLDRHPVHPVAVVALSMALRQTGKASGGAYLNDIADRLLNAPLPHGIDPERYHYAVATICSLTDRRGQAIEHYLKSPTMPQALSRALRLKEQACDWDGYGELAKQVENLARRTPQAAEPFLMLSVSDDPALHKEIAMAAAPRRAVLTPDKTARRDGRKLRIGYLSADFHAHATAYLLTDVIDRHATDTVDVTLYSYGPDDGSEWRKRLQRHRFVDLRALSDADAALRIMKDDLDILVDLKGYTQDHRLGITAHRPARVMVSWLGFPGTLGMDSLDYVIADAFTIPLGHERFFTESVIRMPVTYQPASTDRLPLADEAVDHPNSGIVLAAFNHHYKIRPEMFSVWCRLLNRFDTAVLWLLCPDAEARGNMVEQARRHGIAPDRLVFADRVSLSGHLARYRHATFLLDTWPYSGHTTTSDALLMGCPAVTMVGRSFASRVAGGLLTAVGLDNLVCQSLEQYEATAAALIADPALLGRTRKTLAANAHRLFDPRRFAGELETAYGTIMARWLAGQPPTHFDVPPGDAPNQDR